MKENAMILTIFRSRLNQETRAEYDSFVERTASLAEAQPGFKGHKLFVAEDGERVTLVEFKSMQAQRAWSLSREHVRVTCPCWSGHQPVLAGSQMETCSGHCRTVMPLLRER